ncbi:hypothetical protein [uncultured Draconibacterium sp.]|uniref:hypothetical protein n=1 Tax=uncultured Draconibacterium sp. TaxID=1573823 RepID=UPI002AA5E7DF|nr:hypothetical protein [uncultured Draconibacterium sp.]
MRKHYLIILLGLLINSCATLPSLKIPQSFNPNDSEGVIIGAIAFKNEKPIFHGYSFYYTGNGITKINENNMVRIVPESTVKMKFKPDFFDGDKAVYYFSIQEPEGQYAFSNFKIFDQGIYVSSTKNIPMDIKFNIEKGKVKYLGEIYVDYNQSLIKLNNEKERDIKKMNEQFPNLKID